MFGTSENELHFSCIHCQVDFYYNTGLVSFEMSEDEKPTPFFENTIVCPKCNAHGSQENPYNDFILTEQGKDLLLATLLAEEECDDDCGCHGLDLHLNERDKGKIGRNELCPCESGKKFKKCCLNRPCTPMTDDFKRLLESGG